MCVLCGVGVGFTVSWCGVSRVGVGFKVLVWSCSVPLGPPFPGPPLPENRPPQDRPSFWGPPFLPRTALPSGDRPSFRGPPFLPGTALPSGDRPSFRGPPFLPGTALPDTALPWTALPGTALPRTTLPLDGPKFRSFFPLSRRKIRSVLLPLRVFSWNFGGVFEGRDPQMCTFERPGVSNTTKIPREDPQGG